MKGGIVAEEIGLFGDIEDLTEWKKEWRGMPEHKQEDLQPRYQIEVQFMHKMVNGLPDTKFGAYKVLIVNFETIEDIQKFSELIGIKGINCETKSFIYIEPVEIFAGLLQQKITKQTPSIWYPEAEIGVVANKLWVDKETINA